MHSSHWPRLLFTPHTRIKVPVDSRISDNSQRQTTQQRHNLRSKLGAQEAVYPGAGGWYHPILIPEIQGHISIVCKAKHAQALFGKREKNGAGAPAAFFLPKHARCVRSYLQVYV